MLLALFTMVASTNGGVPVVYQQVRQNPLIRALRASLLQPDSLSSVCLCSLSVIVACMALPGWRSLSALLQRSHPPTPSRGTHFLPGQARTMKRQGHSTAPCR